jgi:hypothetical protein
MRNDLDRLMQERGVAGLVVFAYDRYNPSMYYMTGQKPHYGIYFRAADGRAYHPTIRARSGGTGRLKHAPLVRRR